MAELLIGFDSAWADNPKAPGAICALRVHSGGRNEFLPPRLVGFDDASDFVAEVSTPSDFILMAIDQPLVVNNPLGGRPCEKVAASVVSAMKGGVQPANLEGSGLRFFGPSAGIRRFLGALNASQNLTLSRTAATGRFCMEVFPALALATLAPETWRRRRAAKYNPANRAMYDPNDWRLVCRSMAETAGRFGLADVADYLMTAASLPAPRKADQDRLDAVICLVIAWIWRKEPAAVSIVIGCGDHGYIVTPAEGEVRERLLASAHKRAVPTDGNVAAALPFGPASLSRPLPEQILQAGKAMAKSTTASRIDLAELRGILVDRAQRGRTISYGEVAAAAGTNCNQGFGASLKKALGQLSRENARNGEPQLMCLVVNGASRRPSDGFYALMRDQGVNGSDKELFSSEKERCFHFVWRA